MQKKRKKPTPIEITIGGKPVRRMLSKPQATEMQLLQFRDKVQFLTEEGDYIDRSGKIRVGCAIKRAAVARRIGMTTAIMNNIYNSGSKSAHHENIERLKQEFPQCIEMLTFKQMYEELLNFRNVIVPDLIEKINQKNELLADAAKSLIAKDKELRLGKM